MQNTRILIATVLGAALIALPATATTFSAPGTGVQVNSQTWEEDGKLTAFHSIASLDGKHLWGVLIVTVNGVERDVIQVDTSSEIWAETSLGDVTDVRSIRLQLRGSLFEPGHETMQIDEYRAILYRPRLTVGPAPILRSLPLPRIPTEPL